ncbi:methyl-accepting chemotaxis (MCP) signaling domain protein [Methyloversatilis sp. RAC08]|uniref:methyl-accepting chemotaxis protein n=1 Tax=Methyloversatilis sp. RAC08 TaxID=1842540 RepID=UPI00083D6961|nr:methyl-accepting chemotaxis protein [Methyloversatilis sp. RAC08]AOF81406.1 methyl-accepting chemotaxis (MCP) signaling domain protein [Methyloversatilis sp. RAC08]
MKNLSIAARLALGFGLIVLIFAAVVVFIEIQSMHIADVSHEVSERTQPKVDAIADLNDAIQRVRVYSRSAIIETENTQLAAVRAKLDKYEAAAEHAAGRLSGLMAQPDTPADEQAAAAAIAARLAAFKTISDDVTALAFANRNAEANELLHSAHGPAAIALNEATGTLREAVRGRNAQSIASLESGADALKLAVLVAAGMVIVASIAISFAITRSITSQLAETLAAVKRIAEGDLRNDLKPEGRSELASVQVEVQAMQQSLRQMVSTIGSANSRLSDSAHQLSGATDQVRSSSESQAELAAAMAASLEEMSTSITHVSELSQEARGTSVEAGHRASEGAADIRAMVSQIKQVTEGIEASSQRANDLGDEVSRITTIVHVIRDVADQTNLLALNAAIEAVRAGEMGRGFAVVADEVRKLAEQSARSASEITQMVQRIQSGAADVSEHMQNTVVRVREGLQMAETAGAKVLAIDGHAQQVVGTISEVSGGLTEQAIASQDLAQRVERIVQMVEENASAAGSVAGSARDLSELSAELDGTVRRFRLAS